MPWRRVTPTLRERRCTTTSCSCARSTRRPGSSRRRNGGGASARRDPGQRTARRRSSRSRPLPRGGGAGGGDRVRLDLGGRAPVFPQPDPRPRRRARDVRSGHRPDPARRRSRAVAAPAPQPRGEAGGVPRLRLRRPAAARRGCRRRGREGLRGGGCSPRREGRAGGRRDRGVAATLRRPPRILCGPVQPLRGRLHRACADAAERASHSSSVGARRPRSVGPAGSATAGSPTSSPRDGSPRASRPSTPTPSLRAGTRTHFVTGSSPSHVSRRTATAHAKRLASTFRVATACASSRTMWSACA